MNSHRYARQRYHQWQNVPAEGRGGGGGGGGGGGEGRKPLGDNIDWQTIESIIFVSVNTPVKIPFSENECLYRSSQNYWHDLKSFPAVLLEFPEKVNE